MVCEVMVVQVLRLRRCNKTTHLVERARLAVSWPVIKKDCLTWAEDGAEMVSAVGALAVTTGVFASTKALALQNNNAQMTSTTATTIIPFFSPNILFTLSAELLLARQGHTYPVSVFYSLLSLLLQNDV